MRSKADVRVSQVPLALLHPVWPEVAPWLALGAEAADEPERELLRKVLCGQAELWVIVDASSSKIIGAFLTKTTEQGASLHMWALAGRNVWAWAKRVHATLVSEGTKRGCRSVLFYGRPGWARFYPDCIIHLDRISHGHMLFERVLP